MEPEPEVRGGGGNRATPYGRFRSAVSAGALTAALHRPQGAPPQEGAAAECYPCRGPKCYPCPGPQPTPSLSPMGERVPNGRVRGKLGGFMVPMRVHSRSKLSMNRAYRPGVEAPTARHPSAQANGASHAKHVPGRWPGLRDCGPLGLRSVDQVEFELPRSRGSGLNRGT